MSGRSPDDERGVFLLFHFQDAFMGQIIALIPAYNEKDHIAAVVQAAKAHLPVWVVDDGSKDDTVRLAEQAGAKVIRQIPNQGKGAALKRGFAAALDEGVEAVITLDGDGQHDPAEMPHFLEEYARSPRSMIIGKRDFSKMPFSRRLANTSGGLLFSWSVGRKIADNQSGYRLIRGDLMKVMAETAERGFEFEVDMIVQCIKRGWEIGWVPIRTIYAGESSHIQPLQHVRRFMRVAVSARRELRKS